MERVFLSVLNMSLTGAFVIAVIMLARLPLKRAPKAISYALWAVAGFRLVFPFSIESMLGLLPFRAAPIPQNIAMQAIPRIHSGLAAIDDAVSAVLPAAAPMASANPLQTWIAAGTYLWVFGIAAMLVYSFVSIVFVKHRLRGAVQVEDNLYEAEHLNTPFVIGLLRPRIYIPANLSGEERRYIILHEETHILRYDHAVKMLAYLVLCLHWFNPLVWAAFLLMGADMEMSCDERVLKTLGGDIKSAYSLSLVRVAEGHRILNGSPLAFGEGGMKERIKNVLRFKKHSRGMILLAAALAAVLIAGLAMSRAMPPVLRPASGTYDLKNPTEKQKFERLASVTLYEDGRVWLQTPPISSYLLPDCYSSVANGQLLIHADVGSEEGAFGVKSGDVIARFTIADENTLVFRSAAVPLFADEGARYVRTPDTPSASAYRPQVWLDFYQVKEFPWGDTAGRSFPEFPGAEFLWTPEKITVKDAKGEWELFPGMPIWNVYMADLTGDGLPEFCATVSIGSGLVDERIIVYDYSAGNAYELSDRGYYDYVLFMENGRLMAGQIKHTDSKREILAAGELVIAGDELTAIGLAGDSAVGPPNYGVPIEEFFP